MGTICSCTTVNLILLCHWGSFSGFVKVHSTTYPVFLCPLNLKPSLLFLLKVPAYVDIEQLCSAYRRLPVAQLGKRLSHVGTDNVLTCVVQPFECTYMRNFKVTMTIMSASRVKKETFAFLYLQNNIAARLSCSIWGTTYQLMFIRILSISTGHKVRPYKLFLTAKFLRLIRHEVGFPQ